MKTLFVFYLTLIGVSVQAQYVWDAVKDSEERPLKENSSLHYDQIKTPTEEVLTKLLFQSKGIAVAFLDKKNRNFRIELDRNISSANGSELTDLATLFFLKGSSYAAVYLYAIAAERNRIDTTIYRNLGVCLKNIDAYILSYKILLYARKQTPQNPTLLANLGWVATSVGDFTTGKKHFENALLVAPNLYHAMNGLATIAEARGQNTEADRWRKLAWSKKMTFAGAIQKKDDQAKKIAKVNQNEGMNESTTLPAVNDVLPLIDYEERPFGGNAASGLHFPEPPAEYSSNLLKTMQNERIIEDFHTSLVDENHQRIERVMASLSTLETQWQEQAKVKVTDNHIVVPYPYTKELAALDYYEQLFSNRSIAFTRRFNNETKGSYLQMNEKFMAAKRAYETSAQKCGDNEGCQEQVRNKYCQNVQKLLNNHHQYFYSAWLSLYKNTTNDIRSYESKTDRHVMALKNPQLHQLANTRRKETAQLMYQYGLAHASWATWASNAANTFCEVEEKIEEDSVITKQVQRLMRTHKLELWEDDDECPLPTWNIDAGVIESEANCEKINFSINTPSPGVKGTLGLELTWGDDWGEDELELQAGLKAEKEVGGLSVGGKVVEFITITGNKGIVDAGLKGEATASLSGKISTNGGDLGLKSEGKIEFGISAAKGIAPLTPSQAWKFTPGVD